MLVKIKRKIQSNVRKIGVRNPVPKHATSENVGTSFASTRFKVGHTLRPTNRRGCATLRSQLMAALRKGGPDAARIFLENNNIDTGGGTNSELIVAQMMFNSTRTTNLNNRDTLAWIQETFKQAERPLTPEVDPEDPDPDGGGTIINLTVNAVGSDGTVKRIKVKK